MMKLTAKEEEMMEMMRRIIHILFLLFLPFVVGGFSTMAWGQTLKVRTKLIDEDTKIPIPGVNIYIDGDLKGISNVEGDVQIEVNVSDTIVFALAGYEALQVHQFPLPAVIEMEPLGKLLHEVDVLSDDAVLTNTFKTLKKDAQKHMKKCRLYFNRITMESGAQTEIVEDVMEAESAVNLRCRNLLCGQYWGLAEDGDSVPSALEKIDLHWLSSAGPMMIGHQSANHYTLPFPLKFSLSRFKRIYNMTCDILDGGKNLMYRIHFQRKRPEQQMVLEGDLYVDFTTFRPLKFDGRINMALNIKRQQGSITIYETESGTLNLHISYGERHGFTEVTDMHYEFSTEGINVKSILVNLDEGLFPQHERVAIHNNILDDIRKVKPIHQSLQINNIIKRTAKEDYIINQ